MQADERIVKGPDGIEHHFPSDATDKEISAALGAIPSANAKQAPASTPTWQGLDEWKARTASAEADADTTPVTLGDFLKDPQGSLIRARHILAEDVKDPRLWSGVLMSLVIPKAYDAIMPRIGALKAVAADVGPDALKLAGGYRIAKGIEIAQKVRAGLQRPGPAEPTAPTGPMTPPVSGPPSGAPMAPTPTMPMSAPEAAPAGPMPSVTPGQAMTAIRTTLKDAGMPLTAEETTQAFKWLKAKVAPEDVLTRIVNSRELTKGLKLPTPEEVKRAVADRNTTGEWK